MFNNKFSRLLPHPGYNIGGGIGEAALLGAAVGGGTALVTGQDVLTGALLGGATGGITGGLTGGVDPTAATTAMPSVQGTVQNGVIQGANTGLNVAGTVNPALTSNVATPTLAAPGSTSFWQGANTAALPTQAIPQASQGAVQTTALPGAQQGLASTTQAAEAAATQPGLLDRISTGYGNLTDMEKIGVGIGGGALLSAAMAPGVEMPEEEEYKGPLSKFKYNPNNFNPTRVVPNTYQPRYAQGGIAALAGGSYPMGRQNNTQFATPTQMPTSAELIRADYEPVEMAVGGMTGIGLGDRIDARGNYNPVNIGMADFGRAQTPIAPPKHNPLANFRPTRNINAQRPAARQVYRPRYAEGGIAEYSLGGYAAGGNPRLLKGPGDGMSDDIPATIANKQPARLADGEFVVPADVVSHLGNGSTDAGAKHLYTMMDKVRKARTGSKKQGKQIKPAKFMPR
jgi:hypothetical protein